ncbi:MAG: type II toxin-antitoxin system RelE/ParE family toxin [Gallionellaceae bacterium]
MLHESKILITYCFYLVIILVFLPINKSNLRIPTVIWLEALKDDRKGQYSIRINDQWRICCIWTKRGPGAVEIVHYH